MELKNCPHCGGKGALRSHIAKSGSHIVFGKCDECGASTKSFCYVQKLPDGTENIDGSALQKAADAWDRRV